MPLQSVPPTVRVTTSPERAPGARPPTAEPLTREPVPQLPAPEAAPQQ